MKKIEVCFTPSLIELYNLDKKVVVVVDILRATSCMTTAMANGVKSIIPVATIEECFSLRNKGFIAAAERDGKMADGFDLGNSPFSYMDKALQGKTIAVTTTNGTLAITKSKKAEQVIVGSFLNKSAVANYLASQPNDVIILCAGWKGKTNIEDTLFAGALVDALKDSFTSEDDSTCVALTLYNTAKDDMLSFIAQSSHVRRLKRLNIHKDIEFCLKEDVYNVIPVLKDNMLVPMEFDYEYVKNSNA